MLDHDLLGRAAAIIRNNAEALREGHTVGGKFDEGDEAQAVVETEISVAAELDALASRLQEKEGQPALSDEQIDAIGIQLLKGGAYETICGSVPYGAELQPLLRATVHAALATLAAGSQAVQVPGWRPIETAPMDGTAVLAFWQPSMSDVDDRCYAVTRFDGAWLDMEDEELSYRDPTHWQPLPPPPLQPLAGGGK